MHFINEFHNSTTYLIHVGKNKYVIIDPGYPDIKKVSDWVLEKKGRIIGVFLTHEHADHCAGVCELCESIPLQLYCTRKCAENIANSKQNFSQYIDAIPTFEIHLPVIVVEDFQSIRVGSLDFTFIETPGHSPGSMCILTENSIYTGDTLLYNTKTPLNFPHSNKNDYFQSIERLKTLIRHEMIIYPGHGEPFKI